MKKVTKLISIKFELDLLVGFKLSSKKKHLPYQTYIKTVLYERLESDIKSGLITSDEINDAIKNEAIIPAIIER